MKATPAHWARTAAALGATLACWAGWLHGGVLATLLLPACQWVLAAHTVHEATHGALSTDSRINYVAQFTAHPILFNVFVWIPQHLMSHHQYTNDHDLDVDVHHFAPAKLAAAQPAVGNTPGAGDGPPPKGLVARLTTLDGSTWNEGWTFVWKGCLTTLGTSVLQPLRTLTEKPTPNFDANITPVPAAVSKRTLLLSMLPSFFVLLYPLAALALGWVSAPVALLLEVWPWVGMSMIWTAMTQTSHVQAQCQPDEGSPLQRSCWTARQIQTSLDYSAGEPWPTYLTAGLNSQGLHHAMPAVSCCHFPEIYGEYREICARHGVEVRESENSPPPSADVRVRLRPPRPPPRDTRRSRAVGGVSERSHHEPARSSARRAPGSSAAPPRGESSPPPQAIGSAYTYALVWGIANAGQLRKPVALLRAVCRSSRVVGSRQQRVIIGRRRLTSAG